MILNSHLFEIKATLRQKCIETSKVFCLLSLQICVHCSSFQLKANYTFNHPDEDLSKAVKSGAVLDLSKTDDTQESNDLNFSPTANASYEKSDSKWRLSPKSTYSFQIIPIIPNLNCVPYLPIT